MGMGVCVPHTHCVYPAHRYAATSSPCRRRPRQSATRRERGVVCVCVRARVTHSLCVSCANAGRGVVYACVRTRDVA